MYLIGHVGSPEMKQRFLKPLVEGRARSAFFMTEPAAENGAGSDPSTTKMTKPMGNDWVMNGRKAFITGARVPASAWIMMAKADEGACMFLLDLPDPAIRY